MTQPEQRQDARQDAHQDPAGAPRQPGPPPERSGRFALLLGLPGVILSISIDMFPVGPVLNVAALIIGIRALRRAGRQGVKAPGAIAGVTLGSVGLLLTALVGTLFLVFWTEVSTYRECVSGANTITAGETCRAELRQSLEERFGMANLDLMSASPLPTPGE